MDDMDALQLFPYTVDVVCPLQSSSDAVNVLSLNP
jgi:hypothetical protein